MPGCELGSLSGGIGLHLINCDLCAAPAAYVYAIWNFSV